MTLEKLIACTCRHTVDFHDNFGCHGRGAPGTSGRCQCALRPNDVVDGIIAIELRATKRRWTAANTVAPSSDDAA